MPDNEHQFVTQFNCKKCFDTGMEHYSFIGGVGARPCDCELGTSMVQRMNDLQQEWDRLKKVLKEEGYIEDIMTRHDGLFKKLA